MILHVTKAKYLHDYVIWLRFNDGTSGEVDLENELNGTMFEPLKDIESFKYFHVDPILDTIVWDNGADLALEFLYDRIKVLTK
jgi:hypothetical protein